jgi:phosphoribosylanthranilate isomerase
MTRVKICGVTREADVAAAVGAGADAVGFVVDVPVDTHREVSPARAADLAAAVPPFVASVAVTMPETPADAVELVERVEPDALQVHNDLGDGDLAYLASKVDASVVKRVDAADPGDAHRFDDVADALLVDSVDADGGGGTGRTHDWSATADLAREVASPVVLAGGLTPGNVADAVSTVEPFGVDVASGVEGPDGTKDHDAVARFVSNAKRARTPASP